MASAHYDADDRPPGSGLMLDAVPLIAALLVFAVGGVTDLASYRIPNWISVAAAGLFAAAALLSGMPLSDIGWHFAVGASALAGGFVLFAARLIGGGDAKFFAAGALWVGPEFFLPYCFIFALIGGCLAIVLIAARRPIVARALGKLPSLRHLVDPKAGLPYGVALGAGALLVLPITPIFVQTFHP